MTIDEMNSQAMEMIVHAGNARNLVNEAVNVLVKFDRDGFTAKMKEADAELVKAHKAQTVVLQQTITDPDVRPNILFTHAQDTLMTIMSEYNVAKQLEKVVALIQETKQNG